MNDIFNFFSPLSFVKSGTVAYNPLINYDWSTTTTSGLRYLKDVVSTPTYNASMYFGRGAYLNGVDQSITVPINTTIQTSLKRVNGVVTINETSQTLTNYVIGGLGVHKDYYLFTRLLTTSEKDSYTNTPETFYAMAQSDSTCVLNMPMCETDGYARNMKSYSLGTNFADVNLSSTISGTGNTIIQDVNVFNISSVTASAQTYHPMIMFYPKTFTSDLYNIEIEVKCTSGTLKVRRIECTSPLALDDILTARTAKTYSLVAGFEDIGGFKGSILLDGLNYPIYTAVVTVKKVEKITAGLYPITNYTTSVRDNAKNLRYGLQTCKFVRDSLGVIQSASNYLECDGVGYANTGWIPSATEDWSIETVVNLSSAMPTTFAKWFRIDNVVKLERVPGNVNRVNYEAVGVVGATVGLSTDTSHHIILTTDGNIFIDGILVDSGTPSRTNTIYPLVLGAYSSSVLTDYSKDTIKSIHVHQKALTQEEITKNYNEYVAKGLLS